MNATRTISPVRSMILLGRGVCLELSRRRDLYVLGMLMSLYVLGVFAVKIVGIENASTATFLLNLGLTLAYVSTHLLALFLSARQIPDDIENRTIYPLLARPLDRETYLLGKWIACSLTGIAVLAVLFVLGWAPVPKMEAYSTPLLGQLMVLQTVSITMLCSVTICLTLFMPRALVIVLVGGYALMGDKLSAVTLNGLGDSPAVPVLQWVFQYLPDFSKLNLITRYTDGLAALRPPEFAGLVLYGAVFIAFSLVVAVARFRKMAL